MDVPKPPHWCEWCDRDRRTRFFAWLERNDKSTSLLVRLAKRWVRFTTRLGLWKLGGWWHQRRHVTP
jgi:hypothetical protein